MSSRVKEIADNADMIIGGYAFTKADIGYRVIDLNDLDHAMIINKDSEVIETTMDDIEMSIVTDLFNQNKCFIGG